MGHLLLKYGASWNPSSLKQLFLSTAVYFPQLLCYGQPTTSQTCNTQLSIRRSASDTSAVASCSASEIVNRAAGNLETCRFLLVLHSCASSGLGINNLCSLYFFQDKPLVIKCLSLSKPRDIEEGTIMGTDGPESNFLKN